MTTDETTATRTPEQMRADLEWAHCGPTESAPPSRARQLVTAARTKAVQGRTAMPENVRRAGRTVNDHRVPVGAAVLALAAAVAAALFTRRQAAARTQTRPKFFGR